MRASSEVKNSNHTLRPKVLAGLSVMSILALVAFVTMFLIAVISVG